MLGVNINYYDKNILFFLIIWLFNIKKKGVFYGLIIESLVWWLW